MLIKPTLQFNPLVHVSYISWRVGSASAERVGQGGAGWRRVRSPAGACWDPVGQLLPWPNVYSNRKHYSCRGSQRPGRVPWALSGCCATESADYYLLANQWAWLSSRLEVNLNSVLESELRQKWRYGALKACIGQK